MPPTDDDPRNPDALRASGKSESAARGPGTRRVPFRHIAPNAPAPVLVRISLGIGFAIISGAGLSYLGLGARAPDPSWGTMLQEGQTVMAPSAGQAFVPGMAIVLTVLAFILLGDVLRGRIAPRLRGADSPERPPGRPK